MLPAAYLYFHTKQLLRFHIHPVQAANCLSAAGKLIEASWVSDDREDLLVKALEVIEIITGDMKNTLAILRTRTTTLA